MGYTKPPGEWLSWLFERFAAEIQGELGRTPAEPPVLNLPKSAAKKDCKRYCALFILTAEAPNRSQNLS
jgi:hypothetical protein